MAARKRTTQPAFWPEPPTKPAVNSGPFQAAWSAAWQARYGRSYPWLDGGRDGAVCRRLWAAMQGNVEHFTRVARAYLDTSEPFLARRAHPLWAIEDRLPGIEASLASSQTGRVASGQW